MYSVLIADDEVMIREGLRDLIDWHGLGFAIAALLEDGGQVIEYIGKAPVDLVITDIKMTRTSGLEVARYIHENRPDTKVILISGYREVDLAMSAIKYGVQEYILKPIDVDELAAALRAAKADLDMRRETLENNLALSRYRDNMEEMKDMFFEEMMMGSFRSMAHVSRMFSLVYPSLCLNHCQCFVFSLTIHQYESFIRDQWDHTSGDLYAYLGNCISIASNEIEFRMLAKESACISLMGIVVKEEKAPDTLIDSGIQALCRHLRDIFGIRCEVSGLMRYESIPAFLAESSKDLRAAPPSDLLLKLNEQRKILYSVLREGQERETAETARKFAAYLSAVDIDNARSALEDCLLTISAKLMEGGISPAGLPAPEDARQALGQQKTHEALEMVFEETLTNLARQLYRRQADIIEQAKAYIIKHITEDISLEDVADRFYLSQYHFSRTFKAKTGETLIGFVVRNKMEYAMYLLKDSNCKVYEVCEQVGYKSLRYFTKVFKNHTGLTPSAYRQAIMQEAQHE